MNSSYLSVVGEPYALPLENQIEATKEWLEHYGNATIVESAYSMSMLDHQHYLRYRTQRTWPLFCLPGVVVPETKMTILKTFCETYHLALPFTRLEMMMGMPLYQTDISLANNMISSLTVDCELPSMYEQLVDPTQLAFQFSHILRPDANLLEGFRLTLNVRKRMPQYMLFVDWVEDPPSRDWMIMYFVEDLMEVFKALYPVAKHIEGLGQGRNAFVQLTLFSNGFPEFCIEIGLDQMLFNVGNWADYFLNIAADPDRGFPW